MSDTILTIAGDFGIYRAAELKPLIAAQVADFEEPALDLGAITEMDSAGLQLLLFAEREAAARGRTLRIAAASPVVADVLKVSGVQSRFASESGS